MCVDCFFSQAVLLLAPLSRSRCSPGSSSRLQRGQGQSRMRRNTRFSQLSFPGHWTQTQLTLPAHAWSGRRPRKAAPLPRFSLQQGQEARAGSRSPGPRDLGWVPLDLAAANSAGLLCPGPGMAFQGRRVAMARPGRLGAAGAKRPPGWGRPRASPGRTMLG